MNQLGPAGAPPYNNGVPYSHLVIAVLAAGLLCTPASAQQAVSSEALDQYVRVSSRDSRYFELTNGQPYIPNGLNLIAPRGADGDAGLATMERWIAALSANGGNYIRVWLSSPFWDVEHQKAGVYDEQKAQRIDRLLELCRRYGIRVKMTIEHFRTIKDPRQPWADKALHHPSEGGLSNTIAEFFDTEPAREQFRGKIRWYANRYGEQPIIFGWELWNEINAVRGGDYMGWTALMLPELHKAFPRNLAMQSLGSFDRMQSRDLYRRHSLLPGNDLAQVHRYLDLGAEWEVCHGPVDVLAAEAVRELISYQPQRPVILAESGAVEPRHTGPFKLYGKDKAGIILHDVLFAPFFAGAAGAGQIWHWDQYVAENNLWHHFGRFAEVVKDIDPAAERFRPSMMEHPRLRVYSLHGDLTMLFWIRDPRNTWMTELRDDQAPETIRGAILNLDPVFHPAEVQAVRVYDPWRAVWSEPKRDGMKIRLPEFSRSLVVRVNRRLPQPGR